MGLSRLLLCGDVRGAFPLLARFAKQIQQKQGPFDALVCCGSFFGPLSHRTGPQSLVKTEQDSGVPSPKPVDDQDLKDNRNGVKHSEDDNEKTHLSDGENSDEVFVRDVIRQAYSEKLEELCSLSESFPFPVFLVDGDLSGLLIDSLSAGSTGSVTTSTPRVGESQCSNGANTPLVKQEENSHLDTQTACPPSTPILSSANGLQEPSGASSLKTEQLGSGAQKEKLLGVCSSPIPICTNVFWLGNAGLAKIAGLKIAFFGLSEEAPWKDDPSAKGGEGPARSGEPQRAVELISSSETQEKKERKEVENDDRPVSCGGERGVDGNDVESEEGGSSSKRRRVMPGEQGAENSDSQDSYDSSKTRESPDGLVNKGNLAKTALAKLVSQANEPEWRGRIDVFISSLWPLGVTTKETDKNGSVQQGDAVEMLADFKALAEKADVSPDDLRANR